MKKFEFEVVGPVGIWISLLLHWRHLTRMDVLSRKNMAAKGNNMLSNNDRNNEGNHRRKKQKLVVKHKKKMVNEIKW